MKNLLLTLLSMSLFACSVSDPETTARLRAQSIEAGGEIIATRTRSVTPPQFENAWNVKISMLAPDGSRVMPGMPIVRFDTQELMEKLRTAKADVEKKNRELEQQEITARQLLQDLRLAVSERRSSVEKARLKADIPNTLIARKEYRKNQLNLKLAELEFARAQAALRLEERLQEVEKQVLESEHARLQNKVDQLQADIDKATVIADSEGIFVVGRDRRGNRVKVGDQVWRGRTVAEIPDMSSLQILLQIPEREAARVKAGQRVRFRLDAKPEKHFEGVVVSRGAVMRSRSRTQPARVFDAEVEIERLDPELMRPGMRVSAEIMLGAGA